ncbi:MAG: 30S ribosomal protein S3 [Acidobacteria bacterium]|nr:30S ribosomal protein S3 [Acidobacteriota bacterium]
MGQKIHPYGLRLGIITDWKSRWYSEKDYALLVNEDNRIRKYLLGELKRGAVSRIDIERLGDKKVQIDIHTGRPGVVIGRGGSEADRLRAGLEALSGRQVKFNVIEVANPELDATLLARSVADQLEGRVAFRRAMKRAVSTALKAGAEGVRIQASGRLGGSDMGRREWYLEGRVPLHTLRADVDYGTAVARTSVGAVGIKCWVYKGDILISGGLRSDKISAEARLAAGGPAQRRRSARSRAETAAGDKVGGKRLIEAGGGKRTVEAGGKRLIEAGGGKRKATAADAAAEFAAAREEAEEVVEDTPVGETEVPSDQLPVPSPEAEGVVATESLPEKAQREDAVTSEASAEEAASIAAEEVVATESLPEKAQREDAVTSEASAEEEASIAAEEVVATESVESPESRVESSGPEEVVATESLPEEAKREDAVTAEGLPEAAESMAVEETAPEQGSWRGEGEPPAGFSIKGKESSMLFHRPDSSMYNRTKAEVWFNTEEAAQAAGFTAAKTHPNSRESTVESREQDDTPDSGLSTQDSSDSDSEGGAG